MTHKSQPTRGTTGNAHGPGMLRECAESCSATLDYCLKQGGHHVEESHIKALVDCAEICNVTANFVARASKIHATVAKACAEACEQCAATCEGFEGDETMKACAEVCRRCEQMIRAELKHHG